MSQERSEAIVLRGVDFSETSRIVTFLTPERGRMACIAQGVRRARNSLAPVLDTFNRVELVYYWKDGRSVQKLAEAALLDGFPALKADLEKSVHAAFPLELACKVAQENEPLPQLYDMLVCGFDELGRWHGSARAHAAWLTLQLLSIAGYEMAVPPPDAERAGLAYDSGIVKADEPSDMRLAPQQVECFRAMLAARDACPVAQIDATVWRGVGNFAARQVDSTFRSLHVINQMFSNG